MIYVSIGYILHLHNYIPITREDTHRGSTATTLRRAVERTKAETNAAHKARQERPVVHGKSNGKR